MNSHHKGLAALSVLLALVFLTVARGQEPGKLTPEQQLQTLPNDSSRIKPLFKVANSFLYSDSVKTLRYIRQGLELTRKYNNLKWECNFTMLWAEVYTTQGRFDLAIPILEKAHDLGIRSHNDYMLASYEQIRGVICNETGDYPGAIVHDINYMRQGEAAKDTQMILVGLVNISVAYEAEKNYAKTVEYAQRILKYPYKPLHVLAFTKALEMISTAYIQDHKYAPARDSLQKALQLYSAENNEAGMATVYSVLVEAYPSDPYHQLEYALPAQERWERLAPENGYAITNLGNLGAIYAYLARVKSGLIRDSNAMATYVNFNGKETPASRALREAATLSAEALKTKARQYYTLALDRATRVNNREGLMQVSDSLANLDAFDGRYKEAYAYLQRHELLYDSVFSQENKNHLAGIEADYKVELSEKQLQINKLALSGQIRIKWLLITSLSLVLLILGLIYRQSRIVATANRKLEEANRVKTQFFGILNHDLRSPVASLITLLRLHQREPGMIDEQAVMDRTDQITLRAEQLLETMEDLLIWTKGQMDQFRPKIRSVPVARLFGDLQMKFAHEGVILHIHQPPGLSVNTDEDFAKTILRNLTGNALKALRAQQSGGEITWKAWPEADSVWLSITDNGPGATDDQLNALFDETAPIGIRNGLGLHIVRDMAKAIGCEVQTHAPQSGGLEVRLRFPNISPMM